MPSGNRRFSLVHISDLHLNGRPERLDNVKALIGNLRSIHPSLHPHVVLVITGDVTDSPKKATLQQARSLMQYMKDHFQDVFYVAGNHDVKRLLGNFWRKGSFEKAMAVPAPLRIDDLGLLIVGFDSNSNSFAKGGISEGEFDQFMHLNQAPSDVDGNFQEFRVATLHHHPLPLPVGEDYKIGGLVREDRFMYLEKPGKFLHSCISWNIRLVLHGHKHVHGLAKYSVPTSRSIGDSAGSYSRWDTLYVLSCPSSTGKDCDAGFNVVDFDLGETVPGLTISRYRREHGTGGFAPIDANEADGRVHIYLTDTESDPAIAIRRQLGQLGPKSPPEVKLYSIVEGLFRRGAFRHPHATEGSWGRFYHAVVLTRIVWDEGVVPHLTEGRMSHSATVVRVLTEYEQFLAKEVFGISDTTAAALKGKIASDNKERALQFLPILPEVVVRQKHIEWNDTRKELLTRLEGVLTEMGIRAHLVERGA